MNIIRARNDGPSMWIFPHLFGPLALLALVTSLFIGTIATFRSPPERAGTAPGLDAPAGPSSTTPAQPTNANKSTSSLETGELFKLYLSDYKDRLGRFDTNMKVQVGLILIAIVLLTRKTSSVIVFGTDLPLSWLHLVVPLAMLALWLQFGFLLDGLIEDRIRGVWLINQMKVDHPIAAKSLFSDAGMIDGWIITYVDPELDPASSNLYGAYSGIKLNSETSAAGFLLFTLGMFMVLHHACTIAVAATAARRFIAGPRRWRLAAYYASIFLPAAIFLVSHYQFTYGGANRNNMQAFVAAGALAVLAGLLILSLRTDVGNDLPSVACLRRRLPRFKPTAPAGKRALSMAVIGDSLTTEFAVRDRPSMVVSLWRSGNEDWFNILCRRCFDRPAGFVPSAGEPGVYLTHSSNHATAMANMDSRRRSLQEVALNTWHFRHQADEVLAGEFPDVLLIWIGHNAMDCRGSARTGHSLEQQVKTFISNYEVDLRRLVDGAARCKRRNLIVVFGLVNFRAFFQARNAGAIAHKKASQSYPYFARCFDHFASLRPEHWQQVVALADMCNGKLRALCEDLSGEAAAHGIRLVYSPSMASANIADVACLSECDCWHPSLKGHRLLAAAAARALRRELGAIRLS